MQVRGFHRLRMSRHHLKINCAIFRMGLGSKSTAGIALAHLPTWSRPRVQIISAIIILHVSMISYSLCT